MASWKQILPVSTSVSPSVWLPVAVTIRFPAPAKRSGFFRPVSSEETKNSSVRPHSLAQTERRCLLRLDLRMTFPEHLVSGRQPLYKEGRDELALIQCCVSCQLIPIGKPHCIVTELQETVLPATGVFSLTCTSCLQCLLFKTWENPFSMT